MPLSAKLPLAEQAQVLALALSTSPIGKRDKA